eukprot:TRINITY_DN3435_c0_g1_i4.p1 TRINITY_DN3435_c0_g1~~TRINITY_DN3435_c0_g1_i4.p1  ORF type:complete len:1300 (-),score=267.02 TRINITY_DN3435_c0_g1_i4:132-3977(-)
MIIANDLCLTLQQRTRFSKKLTKETIILHDVSLHARPGEVLGIMGGSGSGKTSLLNLLAGRLRSDDHMTVTGERSITHEDDQHTGDGYNRTIKCISGFVQQEDFLRPQLSVRETLRYSARLMLPSGMALADKYARVEEVIRDLGLRHCADTLIGDEWSAGISGGEKRRVSVAIQILTHPAVLFLDEPTSGLDAFTALHLMETLRTLAQAGQTIVCSIHQPREDIFRLLDSVMLLARGHVVYYGPQRTMMTYFANLNIECPPETNPADFFLDISSVDSNDPETSLARVHFLADRFHAFAQAPAQYHAESDAPEPMGTLPEAIQIEDEHDPRSLKESLIHKKKRASSLCSRTLQVLGQVRILSGREFVIMKRSLGFVCACLGLTILLALFMGWMYFQIPDNLAGIKTRMAMSYSILILQPLLVLVYSIYNVSHEYELWVYERQVYNIHAFAFRMSKFFSGLPLDLFLPTVYSAITFWMIGVRHSDDAMVLGTSFLWFGYVMVMMHITIQAVVYFCVACFRKYELAALAGNSIIGLCSLSTGFLVNKHTSPVYISWLQYLSFFEHGNQILLYLQFDKVTFACPVPEPSNPVCEQYNGSAILSSLGYDSVNYTIPSVVLVGIWAGLIVLSVAIMHALGYKQQASTLGAFATPGPRSLRLSIDAKKRLAKQAEYQHIASTAAPEIGLRLSDVGYHIRKTSIWNRNKGANSIKVLQHVHAEIRPGELCALMGGSGSGKTSLLNLLSGRISTKHADIEGTIHVNGRQADTQYLQGISSYVVQQDHLLPRLSVRETLDYAAQLRLPRTMSQGEKAARVDDLLLQLRLTECANTIIGDDTIRGISGGEKRRVSIAVQMLANPRLLFLDEPTTGLDSFSALIVVEILKQISRSGVSVVCSIHQPRSEIFRLFDRIIMLSKGQVIYEGSNTNIFTHFESMGYKCLPNTNPADFFIDRSLIDTRDPAKESESGERVRGLLREWAQRPASFDQNVGTSISRQDPVSKDLSTHSSPVHVALPILVRRNAVHLWRHPSIFGIRLQMTMSYAILLLIYFQKLGSDQYSIQNRIGILYSCLTCVATGIQAGVAAFLLERNHFYRERADRSHSTFAFFVSYFLVEFPIHVLSALIFSVMVYFPLGLHPGILHFTLFYCVMLAIVVCGESIALIFCAIAHDGGLVMSLSLVFFCVTVVMSGFFNLSMNMIVTVVNWFSICRTAAYLLALNEFEGLALTCTPEQQMADGACPFTSGDEVLKLYNFHSDEKTKYMLLVASCVVVYRVLAFVTLRLIKRRMSQ